MKFKEVWSVKKADKKCGAPKKFFGTSELSDYVTYLKRSEAVGATIRLDGVKVFVIDEKMWNTAKKFPEFLEDTMDYIRKLYKKWKQTGELEIPTHIICCPEAEVLLKKVKPFDTFKQVFESNDDKLLASKYEGTVKDD